MISEACVQVKSKTIKNCFVKAGFPYSHNETSDDDTVILDEEHWKSFTDWHIFRRMCEM